MRVGEATQQAAVDAYHRARGKIRSVPVAPGQDGSKWLEERRSSGEVIECKPRSALIHRRHCDRMKAAAQAGTGKDQDGREMFLRGKDVPLSLRMCLKCLPEDEEWGP
jgi:hypothetical protein